MLGSFSVTKLPSIEYKRSAALADDAKNTYPAPRTYKQTAKPALAALGI